MTPDHRRARFEADCRRDGIVWEYTADPIRWKANLTRRRISVPPPIDDEAEDTCDHERHHILLGPCPRSGLHFWTKPGCLECERLCWEEVKKQRVKEGRSVSTALLRECLGSYRAGRPAPYAAMQAADRALGRVSALTEVQKRAKWQMYEDRNRAAGAGWKRTR